MTFTIYKYVNQIFCNCRTYLLIIIIIRWCSALYQRTIMYRFDFLLEEISTLKKKIVEMKTS